MDDDWHGLHKMEAEDDTGWRSVTPDSGGGCCLFPVMKDSQSDIYPEIILYLHYVLIWILVID